MTRIDLDAIRPLVADTRERGRTVLVVFRCPETGTTTDAAYEVPTSMLSGVGQAVSGAAGRTVSNSVRRSIGPMLRGVFGRGMVGRMASDAVGSVLHNATSGLGRGGSAGGSTALSEADKQRAMVEAFKLVSTQFAWDGRRWVSKAALKERMSAFERQLHDHPVSHDYDRDVLARMLVEVAAADGEVSEEEQGFLSEFLGDLSSVRSLLQRPPLTAAELGHTTGGEVRTTLMMLTWVLTLADGDFDEAEHAKLGHFATGLGLHKEPSERALAAAQEFLVEQAVERAITWGGHDAAARAEIVRVAGTVGLSPADAERIEANVLRRRG